jgi:hypothetical protein
MTLRSFSLYRDMPLADLIDKVNEIYYEPIEMLARHINQYCEHLRSNYLLEGHLPYISLCDELVIVAKKLVNHRRGVFIPYLNELAEKDIAGHDCSTCSGRCNVQHGSKLVDFTISIQEVREAIDHLPIDDMNIDSGHNTALKSLHYKATLLESLIKDVLLVEGDMLHSRIKDAQKSIHAVI